MTQVFFSRDLAVPQTNPNPKYLDFPPIHHRLEGVLELVIEVSADQLVRGAHQGDALVPVLVPDRPVQSLTMLWCYGIGYNKSRRFLSSYA